MANSLHPDERKWRHAAIIAESLDPDVQVRTMTADQLYRFVLERAYRWDAQAQIWYEDTRLYS